MQIRKQVFLQARRDRVWRAITTPAEFAQWFGVEIEGDFTPGSRVRMMSTIEGHKGTVFYIHIEQMSAPELFSWRWHPGADASQEFMTTVTFRLDEVAGGTTVTVMETGFENIDVARRAALFEENSAGWEYQNASLSRYIGGE